MEIFQWLTAKESESLDAATLEHAGEELADILQYVVRLSDILGIDLADALWSKLEANESRYSPDDIRGSAAKR